MSSETREELLWLTLIILVLFGVVASGSAAFAIPHVYVSDSGNDTNDGSNGSPVQTEAGITRLCSVNGVMPDQFDTGLKWSPGDTPTMVSVEFLELFSRKKADRVTTYDTATVVPGHGALPSVDTVGSADNGWRVKKRYIWATFTNQYGPQEYQSGVVTDVEIY